MESLKRAIFNSVTEFLTKYLAMQRLCDATAVLIAEALPQMQRAVVKTRRAFILKLYRDGSLKAVDFDQPKLSSTRIAITRCG